MMFAVSGTRDNNRAAQMQTPRRGVGIKQIAEQVWLVSFMRYGPVVFDNESCRVERAENPFVAEVLPMPTE